MEKTLIVALDGMDYDLVREYSLENIPQAEFGKIENTEGISSIVTGELFASFITGEKWEEHGVIGLNRMRSDRIQKIEDLNRYRFFQKFKGVRKFFYKNLPFVDSSTRYYTEEDLGTDTIFDHASNPKAIDVPSYSKGYNWDLMMTLQNFGVKEAVEDLNRFTECKFTELMDSLEDDHDLIMAHFHKPDHIHHWFWEIGREKEVKETYEEFDRKAQKIIEKAEANGFNRIIFMSDHGLPDVESGGHNENAFYSSNQELFPGKKPHITDFYIEITESNFQIEDIDY